MSKEPTLEIGGVLTGDGQGGKKLKRDFCFLGRHYAISHFTL